MFYQTVLGVLSVGLFIGVLSACDPNNCQLPTCYCAKAGVPGNMPRSSIPQMVLFMFDGAVNGRNLPYYQDIFTDNNQNPNNCPIGATVFVSNNFTDYGDVRKLYLQGLEIAVGSVTSRTPTDWWKTASVTDLEFEILQQRSNIETKAEIPRDQILGWRSPRLQSSGENTYKVLQANNFEYDSTVVSTGWTGNASIPGWPFTLDNPYPDRCQIQPCPTGSYPGLWELPVVPVVDIAGVYPCNYLGACGQNPPRNKADVLTLLRKNFQANYANSRAPVYFNLRTDWMMGEDNLYVRDAFLEFVQELVSMDEVYIITAQQLISWMKDPQTLAQAKDFSGWSCPNFVNNEIGIWDHIKNFFTNGDERKPMLPEIPATPRPDRENQIYFVGNNGQTWRISSLTLAILFVLQKMLL